MALARLVDTHASKPTKDSAHDTKQLWGSICRHQVTSATVARFNKPSAHDPHEFLRQRLQLIGSSDLMQRWGNRATQAATISPRHAHLHLGERLEPHPPSRHCRSTTGIAGRGGSLPVTFNSTARNAPQARDRHTADHTTYFT